MFHHSLEHVPDPKHTLETAKALLAPNGVCLVRLPVVAHAWEQYKTNWAQMDPPRHMWLPTVKAVGMLANSLGLQQDAVEFDSTDFQFWGSELLARDVALQDINPRDLKPFFQKGELAKFRERTAILNREGQGDSAVFVFSLRVASRAATEPTRQRNSSRLAAAQGLK